MSKRKLFKLITTGRIENDDEYFSLLGDGIRCRNIFLITSFIFLCFGLVSIVKECLSEMFIPSVVLFIISVIFALIFGRISDICNDYEQRR